MQWPGSKSRLADRIVGLVNIPGTGGASSGSGARTWCEPFLGSASIILGSSLGLPAPVVLLNDLDAELVNLLTVLRSERATELIAALKLTAYAQVEFANATFDPSLDPVERARRFFVRVNQTFVGSASTGGGSWTSTTKGSSSQSNATKWQRYVDRLPKSIERLKACQLTQMDGIELIRKVQGEDAVIYADPPYHRSPTSGPARTLRYRHEAHDDDAFFDELIDALLSHRGQVLLSTNPSDTLFSRLTENGWWRHDIPVVSSSSAGKNTQVKRLEVVFSNRPPPESPPPARAGWCSERCRKAAWRANRTAQRPPRTCAHCANGFVGRSDAQYCGDGCRKAASRQRAMDRGDKSSGS